MTAKVIIPAELMGYDEYKLLKVKFPSRCVFCGGSVESTVFVDFRPNDPRNSNKLGLSNLGLPYCLKDAALNEKLKKQYNYWIGILCFLVILVLVVGWNLAHQPVESFLVLIALVAGGIFLVNKLLLVVVPKFQKIPTFLQKGSLGVIIKIVTYEHATGVELKFSNDEYAAEFAQLNGTSPVKT